MSDKANCKQKIRVQAFLGKPSNVHVIQNFDLLKNGFKLIYTICNMKKSITKSYIHSVWGGSHFPRRLILKYGKQIIIEKENLVLFKTSFL